MSVRPATLAAAVAVLLAAAPLPVQAVPPDPSPPQAPVKLVFVHHSTGEAWLADGHGGLGTALRDARWFVSDTNYGWGPADLDAGSGTIGDHTDIGNWWSWFLGPHRDTHLAALLSESGQHADYSRLAADPGGPNRVVLFKSCFPNSQLGGSPGDPVPPIDANPLRGQDSGSEHHTVANAKGIYAALRDFFATRPDVLFVAVTAPPLSAAATDPAAAANARALNEWLVNDWLSGYAGRNVAVLDFYTVLTSNGGPGRTDDPGTNDLGWADGNHHRFRSGAVEHTRTVFSDVSAYPSDPDDSHPTAAGDRKATGELVALLNVAYNCWRGTGGCPGSGAAPPFEAVVAAAAHSGGAMGSSWRTDLAAVNGGSQAASATFTFAPRSGSPVARAVALAAGEARDYRDVLVSLFGVDEAASTSGSVHVTADRPLCLSSRTFNPTAKGSYGGYLPAVAAAEALGPGKTGVLTHLKGGESFRVNVGLTALGTTAATVALRLRGTDGAPLGREIVLEVPAGGLVQQDDVFAAAGVAGPPIAWATLEVRTAGALVWAYASVIDNRTADPTIVPLVVP